MKEILWRTKLAARIHDPAEKALVLYRDPSGHEGGSIVGVGKELGFETELVTRRDGSQVEKLKLPAEMARVVEQADHWAAAADRAQFPMDTSDRFVSWAQVRFSVEGQLIHPLSGQVYKINGIDHDVVASHIRAASEDLFKTLIQKDDGGTVDFRRTLFAFWRFGPELGQQLKGIGHLWSLLPADTRTPDHTIWQHLDLVSSLAGAMMGNGRPALLTVSLGPVQEFIAAGRSTSDLWAGSHFLSMAAWQAMQVVADLLGPDAILFPQLRGVPVVDLWLMGQGVNHALFKRCEWANQKTDYNPLFGASLPNKFVAVVPEAEGEGLAKKIGARVREWLKNEARAMLDAVLKEIGETPNDQYCYTQIEEQLRDFPEVHWTIVPWLPEGEMEGILKEFYPVGAGRPGFFGMPAWGMLRAPIQPQQDWRFYEPNEGVLYPAVYDCAERLLSAAKSVRAFRQTPQKGYRDSLAGEHEWLTLEKKDLDLPPGSRTNTLWTRVAARKASWAKKGEHLSALGMIKRLWPTRYTDWLKEQGIMVDVSRYVVSTHVMALASSLEKLMRDGPKDEVEFRRVAAQTKNLDRAALPRRLMKAEYRVNQERWNVAARLPTLIDDLRSRAEGEEEENQIHTIVRTMEEAIGERFEHYYALILMDGDRLGAWLSGDKTLKFRETFHAKVCEGLQAYSNARLTAYLDLNRPTSPARHMAISAALNGFSLDLVRHVLEDLCLGKLLYSGGDDVMAMVCVRDLPKALWLLRLVYSGGMPGEAGKSMFDDESHGLTIGNGFVRWRESGYDRLYRVMGEQATASAGAVIAHHMAPLGLVLRNLWEAENEAKNKGGRNAFSIRVIKRSGGRFGLTLPWWLGDGETIVSTMHALGSLRGAIANDMSRRAAYHADECVRRFPWLADPDGLKDLIARTLEYQFGRKGWKGGDDPTRIARVAVREAQRRVGGKTDGGELARHAYDVVQGMLFAAEFLAREGRAGERPGRQRDQEAGHA